MKKIATYSMGVIIMILLLSLYIFDRIITSFIFFIPITPLQDWMPKDVSYESVKKTFPTLNEETILQIINDRKVARNQIFYSLMRAMAYTIVLIVYSLIF